MDRNNTNQVRFSNEKERLDFFNLKIMPHEKLIRGICAGILESSYDIDDAVQDTLLCAWNKLDSLREADAARAWVCTIARHCALNLKEHLERNVSMNCENEFGDELAKLVAAPSPGPEEMLVIRSLLEETKAAYDMLPDKYKVLIYLRFALCMENEEIERTLGIGSRMRINACSKARAALRSNLSKLQMEM